MTSLQHLQLSLSKLYVLDADVFIAAWHDSYPIDVYPGFWECLTNFLQEDRLISIDKVRAEIEGPEVLVSWVKQYWKAGFASTDHADIASAFSEIQNWVQSNSQFMDAAKYEFADKADGWLVAYAMIRNAVVATNEVSNPNAKNRVPLPDLCDQFGVQHCNTIGMLRGLGVTFDLRRS